jgi:hypothetical protein
MTQAEMETLLLRIAEQTQSVPAILQSQLDLSNKMANLQQDMCEQSEYIEKHERTLYGSNGTPGLVETVRDAVKHGCEPAKECQKAIAGDGKVPGFVERLRKIEGSAGSANKVIWLLGSAAIGSGFTILTTLILKSIGQ